MNPVINPSISHEVFEKVLSFSNQDENIVYAVTMDALVLWRKLEKSQRIISEYLETRGNISEATTLLGIINALAEYQLSHKINDLVLNASLRLIENRMPDREEDDIEWIKKGFTLISKDFSRERLKNLFAILKNPFTIPQAYHQIYLSTLGSYLKICRNADQGLYEHIINEIEGLVASDFMRDNYKNEFLTSLSTMLKEIKRGTILLNLSNRQMAVFLFLSCAFLIAIPSLYLGKQFSDEISLLITSLACLALSYIYFVSIIRLSKTVEAISYISWVSFLIRHKSAINYFAASMFIAILGAYFWEEILRPLLNYIKEGKS